MHLLASVPGNMGPLPSQRHTLLATGETPSKTDGLSFKRALQPGDTQDDERGRRFQRSQAVDQVGGMKNLEARGCL